MNQTVSVCPSRSWKILHFGHLNAFLDGSGSLQLAALKPEGTCLASLDSGWAAWCWLTAEKSARTILGSALASADGPRNAMKTVKRKG